VTHHRTQAQTTHDAAPPHHVGRQADHTPQPGRAEYAGSPREIVLGVGGTILLIGGLLLLWYVSQVVLLLFAGLLLAILLRIPTNWLRDHTPLPGQAALIVVLLAVVLLLGAGGLYIAPSIDAQLDELTRTLPQAVSQLRDQFQQYDWVQQLSGTMPSLQQVLPQPGDVLSRLGGVFSGIFSLSIDLIVVAVVGFFLALQPHLYLNGVIGMFSRPHRERTREVLQAVGYSLQWWLISRLFSMTIIGLATGIGLWLLDVPFVLTLAVVSGLLNFIPFVGMYLALVPVALVALLQGPMTLVYVLLLYTGVQMIESYLVTPMIQQRAVMIPPVLAIVVQLLMVVLVGLLGLALAVPITAVGLVMVKLLYVQGVLGDDVDVPSPQTG
jgi:predicted PurR-regulated permease PerM